MDPTTTGLSAVTERWQMLASLLEATRLIPGTLAAPDSSLPLTIVTGFLGAGKTTLLNRLLTDPQGRRIAVLVNDFGRINIDASLIRSRTEDMISLTNGCACCTVSTDLTRTLIQIAQRDERPDAIVLEASGLADPRGIAQVALANPAMRLDGIVTLVDATGHLESRKAQHAVWTIDNQVDAADLLVLSKTDEATFADTEAVSAFLKERHAGKPMLRAILGDLPADVLLGIHSPKEWRNAPPAGTGHSAGFDSWALQSSKPLTEHRLRAFLSGLPSSVIRAKGVLQLAGRPGQRWVYQRVGQRESLSQDGIWHEERPNSTLVLIGPRACLDRDALETGFTALEEEASSNTAQSTPFTPPSTLPTDGARQHD